MSDFEFLIAANGCTDAFFEELCALTAADRRVRVIRTAIGQLAFSLNLLADQAGADWLVRMDADDISLPHRLETLSAAARANAADVVGTGVYLIDETGTRLGEVRPPVSSAKIARAFVWGTPLIHPSVMLRRTFLLEMGGYLGGFRSEDTDLWLRALRSGGRIINLPDVLLEYRVHGGQVSRSRLGYAENAAHRLREFLMKPGFESGLSFFAATAKALVSPLLVRRAFGAVVQPPATRSSAHNSRS